MDLHARASRHAALGDPVRLAIVDELIRSDRAPGELRSKLGIESNLLAHHLDVLEQVGLIVRTRSSGDGRRRYVHLLHSQLPSLVPGRSIRPARALFVCTRNSARSQLAAAIWKSLVGTSADSAGTHPADDVHPGAIAAAERIGLDLSAQTPKHLSHIRKLPPLVVTVCDQAHEELEPASDWLHWSVPDPAPIGSKAAFDAVVAELRDRITPFIQTTPVKGDMQT
jgi:ArsR family transcriptional regulator, arsenate/arsenite/antimonite-responsive transcriptional repressor / arsenate reductase (thioredoxin)